MTIKRILLALCLLCSLTAMRAQSLNGAWQGKLNLGMAELTLVFHVKGTQVTMDSPDQGATDIPTTVGVLTDDSLNVSIPQLAINYAAGLHNGKLIGTFSQGGMSFPMTLQPGEQAVNRPQTPQPPFPYSTEEVSFTTRSGATIAGTLSRPFLMTAGQTPIVLMLTGSGTQDRDETLFSHKPFLLLADCLARNGIASLRCDDRGTGGSTIGDAAKMTTADFADDAADALAYLRSLNKYGKIGVLGHSEGANIAFILGAKGLTDFIVSLAACGVRGDTALAAQVNKIMELSGQPERMTAAEYAAQSAVQENAWLRAFVAYDPTADLQATHCPVFALNGTNDVQVVSDLNLTAIQKALPANSLNKTKAYDGLNHLLQHCTTGLPTEYGQIEETMSTDVLKDIVEWLGAVTK